MEDPIEFSPLDKQIMSSLLEAEYATTPECLDPDTLLDLIEQGERHPLHTPLYSHIDSCMACRVEYALLNQTWRAARNFPLESLDERHPPHPEVLESPTASTRPAFGEWLHRLISENRGVRIAWGAALLMVFVVGWGFWQRRQLQSSLNNAQSRSQTERTQITALSKQLQQAQQNGGTSNVLPLHNTTERNNETKLADSQTKINQLQAQLANAQAASQAAAREVQLKAAAVNALQVDLKRQLTLVRNDIDTNRLLTASIAGLRERQDTVRGSNDIHLRSPRATCVLEARPRFQWTLDNSDLALTAYEITIDGENGYHRVKQLAKDADEWNMTEEPTLAFPPLQRGVIYRWQVRALVTGSAPIVSAVAKFKIASQETVNQIALARRNDTAHPLTLFKSFLQNGLLDDARREINSMLDNLQTPTPIRK